MVRHLLKSLTPTRLTKLWSFPLLALGMGLVFVRLLLMARLLSVQEFAIYSSGILISSSLLMLACLGLYALLQRDFPILIVQRRERSGIVATIQCVLIAAACLIAGSVLVLSARPSLAGISPSMIAIGLLHGFSQQTFLVATLESRSRGEPVRYSLDNLYRAILMLLAGAFAAYLTTQSSYVLLVEAIISLLIALFLLRKQISRTGLTIASTLHLALRRFKKINWSSAVVLMIVGSLVFVMLNADRWLAAEWLSPIDFAQYSFGWTLLMASQAAQAMINTTLYPMIARRFASSGSSIAFKMGAYSSLALLGLGSLFAIPIWFILDYCIHTWYPAYSPARSLLPVFLVIAVLRLSDYWSTYLVIVGKEISLLWNNMAVIVLSLALWWLLFQPTGNRIDLQLASYFAGILALTGYISTAALAIYMNHRVQSSP